MIQKNNNLSPLPFYKSVKEQNHRRSYAFGEVYPLYCPMGMIPPFQIIVPHHANQAVTGISLYKYDGSLVRSILTSEMTGLQVVKFADNDYDVVIFPAIAPMNLTTEEGRFYLQISMYNGGHWYSDIFTVVGDMAGYISLQWYDLDDMVMDGGRIVYADANGVNLYRNTLWLATQLGKPEYPFEEEGETRDGMFFPEKMVSYKKYKCTILAPEYLCDVMRFVALSDFINVIDQNGVTYKCDTFLITPKWETQGDLASVEIEFTTDTVAKKIGRGVAYHHSFNDDYNADYDIDEITT